MSKLKEIKELLEKRRSKEKADLVETATEEDGYFNPMECSGGNFDDCFELGKDVGEAEFVEELLGIINRVGVPDAPMIMDHSIRKLKEYVS